LCKSCDKDSILDSSIIALKTWFAVSLARNEGYGYREQKSVYDTMRYVDDRAID